MDRTDAGRPGARGITPALAVSAAGHVLLLSAALLFGPAASIVPRTGVVELVLVDWGGSAGVPGAGAAHHGGSGVIPGDGAARTARERGARDLPGASVTAPPRTAVEPGDLPAGNASAPPAGANPAPPGAAAPAAAPVATSGPAATAALPPAVPGISGSDGASGPIREGSARDMRASPGPGGAAGASPGGGRGLFGETRRAAVGGSPGGGGGDRAEGSPAMALREKILSRIVYPAEAVRRGQEGEVLLRIRVDKRGNPAEIRVTRSSGMRLLDDAALRGVLGSAPLPAIPGWVEVPVRFFLR